MTERFRVGQRVMRIEWTTDDVPFMRFGTVTAARPQNGTYRVDGQRKNGDWFVDAQEAVDRGYFVILWDRPISHNQVRRSVAKIFRLRHLERKLLRRRTTQHNS